MLRSAKKSGTYIYIYVYIYVELNMCIYIYIYVYIMECILMMNIDPPRENKSWILCRMVPPVIIWYIKPIN